MDGGRLCDVVVHQYSESELEEETHASSSSELSYFVQQSDILGTSDLGCIPPITVIWEAIEYWTATYTSKKNFLARNIWMRIVM
jgi:hypothetical protein